MALLEIVPASLVIARIDGTIAPIRHVPGRDEPFAAVAIVYQLTYQRTIPTDQHQYYRTCFKSRLHKLMRYGTHLLGAFCPFVLSRHHCQASTRVPPSGFTCFFLGPSQLGETSHTMDPKRGMTFHVAKRTLTLVLIFFGRTFRQARGAPLPACSRVGSCTSGTCSSTCQLTHLGHHCLFTAKSVFGKLSSLPCRSHDSTYLPSTDTLFSGSLWTRVPQHYQQYLSICSGHARERSQFTTSCATAFCGIVVRGEFGCPLTRVHRIHFLERATAHFSPHAFMRTPWLKVKQSLCVIQSVRQPSLSAMSMLNVSLSHFPSLLTSPSAHL